jgi:HD-like signal output (HDOD) protein
MIDARDLEPMVMDLVKRDVVPLPSYPAAALRLQSLVGSGRYGTADLVKIIGADQALAVILLRSANSARFRGVERITSLHDAITRMGANEVCRTAMVLSVASQATAAGSLAELRRDTWSRSFMSAVLSQHLAERRGLRRDEAFVCGLLHDFGRVVALSCLEQILKHNNDPRKLTAAIWNASVDRLHVHLGALLSVRWNLSALTRAVIKDHHHPESGGVYRPWLALVASCDELVSRARKVPRFTAAEATGVSGLQRQDSEIIERTMPDLAAEMADLDELDVAAGTDEGDPASQVDTPASALEGLVRRSEFAVIVRHDAKQLKCAGTLIGPCGFGFHGPTRLREHSVVGVAIGQEAPATISAFANVVLCAEDGDGFRIEANLLGLRGEAFASWQRLYNSPVAG